jgi:site-specific recombinase XerD
MLLDNLLAAHLQIPPVPGLDDLLSQPVYKDYLLSCRVGDKSPRTMEVYAKVLAEFVCFLRSQRKSFPAVTETTKTDVRLFMLSMMEKRYRGKPLSPFTIHQYYRSLKSFFNWCIGEEILKVSPMQNIDAPILPKYIIKPFSKQDIDKFITLTNGKSFLELRNRAIIYMFMESGPRLAEMIGIRLSDIDFDRNVVIVFGKGRKERILPIGKHTQRAIAEYLLSRNDELPELWLTEERRPMKRKGLQSVIRRLAEQAGTTATKKGPHEFRHTAAHFCRQNGMTIEEIQNLFGHSSPETTRKYLGAFDPTEQMIAAHRRASPVDNYLKRTK